MTNYKKNKKKKLKKGKKKIEPVDAAEALSNCGLVSTESESEDEKNINGEETEKTQEFVVSPKKAEEAEVVQVDKEKVIMPSGMSKNGDHAEVDASVLDERAGTSKGSEASSMSKPSPSPGNNLMTSPSSPLPIGDEAHNNVSPENLAVDTISEAWEFLKANNVFFSEAGEDYLRVGVNKDGKETKMANAATAKVIISNSEATDAEALSQNDVTENLNYRAKVIQADLAALAPYCEELVERSVADEKDGEGADGEGGEETEKAAETEGGIFSDAKSDPEDDKNKDGEETEKTQKAEEAKLDEKKEKAIMQSGMSKNGDHEEVDASVLDERAGTPMTINFSEREKFSDAENDPEDDKNKDGEETEVDASVLDEGAGTSSMSKPSPSPGNNLTNSVEIGSSSSSTAMMADAWEKLSNSYVKFLSEPVGTLASVDCSTDPLNYNQCFIRDFVPCGLAMLMKKPDEAKIVKNFLLTTLDLQFGREKNIDKFALASGVMPNCFKVVNDSDLKKETLKADYGGSSIGRVASMDSGFWWIILLRSYTNSTRDHTLSELPKVQQGIKLILDLCLSDGFDTFPTLLCADGCSMIDRRMGIYGYPIDIQALFFYALGCAKQMLILDERANKLIKRIEKRITALSFHIQNYYWVDFPQLNTIYRYKTEEYSHTAVNKFNVNPESIPEWAFDFMPHPGGYFIGNVSPGRMDFRWFLVGNCISILSSLATPTQATAIMDLIEERWTELIGEMPLKIVYPALEGDEWRTTTGWDPKNTRWSYHNGGSWPVVIWLLTGACIKTGRTELAKRAIKLLEKRLSKDEWPEYYDGKTGRYIGKCCIFLSILILKSHNSITINTRN